MDNRKGLIVGVANEQSIAWGCAKVLHAAGAKLAITYQNNKTKTYIQPLAEHVVSPIFMPLDVTNEEQLNSLFDTIEEQWGRLDFIIHAIAFAPRTDLQGRVVDSSREGFLMAMDISCHSLIRLAKAAEPMMTKGGSIVTMSYYGAEKVVTNYNLMGPVKAALEASVRYLAVELGPKNIRVNALSPGPIQTRAASGLADFDKLMEKAAKQAPLHQRVTLEAIGEVTTFLLSDKARCVTGQVIYVDSGYNIKG
ncbi:enoyl-ACP reductase FabI [Legionella sp. PATHC038]|uniref:enoyl-ACP reductase FabI n=1 Tax=Legionella sheltonii TaxID=2992041 RepID=UPI00224381E3|nr:enoyl-ACP reductase FabI [Legionella sp. PATHC038]MCW8399431.1 enoyl-ACP reductase FabI [Legionella sp. PATHC038]